MYDVVALGELLVDFTPCGVSAQELPVYQANPGGAPCNVLSMLSRLGRRTAFIGKVGHDMFGKMLRRTLQEEGIDDSGLVSSREVNTTLAFVQIDEHGDRDFSFYRNPGADMKLTSGEVDMALVENTRRLLLELDQRLPVDLAFLNAGVSSGILPEIGRAHV